MKGKKTQLFNKAGNLETFTGQGFSDQPPKNETTDTSAVHEVHTI